MDWIERRYAAFLELDAGAPARAAEAPPSPRRPRRAVWVPLAVLAPLPVIALGYGVGEAMVDADSDGGSAVFGVALGLVLLSSLLVVGSLLPPGIVARTPVPPATFQRYRQPLALAAIGILTPVVLFALLITLT